MSTVIPPTDLQRDLDRGWRVWSIKEIYTPGGSGRIVPNVEDLVFDRVNGWLIVISVDYTTGISIRTPWKQPATGADSEEDLLLGSGPGTISESFRLWLNPSVTPHTLTFDSRLFANGTAPSYVKVFRGSDVSESGQVISAYYDQNQNFLGQEIPLEIVGRNNITNIAIKTPKTGYTAYDLQDNEQVTAVVYDDAGGPRSRHNLLIHRSAVVKQTSDSDKYITAISIETPFLSPSDPQTIQFPINMPVRNLNLIGKVTYSDGTSKRMPIDGTKFSIHGLNEFVATVEDQTVPLVLSYALSPGEYSYINNPSANNHISAFYKARTTAMDGAYSIKLFVTPVWIDRLNGYRLEYHLYNLLRDTYYNVTDKVQMATDSSVFDPILYGTVQTLAVAVNLRDVDSRFANYRHVQTFRVALKAEGNDQTKDNWWITYTPGQDPVFGEGVQALARFVNVNNYQVKIDCGATTLAEWLDKVYYPLEPLVDTQSEAVAPVPNYILLVSGNHQVEVPIASWNQTLSLHEVPAEGKPMYLHFMRRGATNDLQLAVAGLITHRN